MTYCGRAALSSVVLCDPLCWPDVDGLGCSLPELGSL